MSERKLDHARGLAIHRKVRTFTQPSDNLGHLHPISSYFGDNVFDFYKESSIPKSTKMIVEEACLNQRPIPKKEAEIVAFAVTDWAKRKGATHFCHWFQPLTGSTAEKHDAFITYNHKDQLVEKLSASQLLQGEPDASSFPNGGSRSTFEARGYTTWDISSPIFIIEGENGKTVCIPTAFISYYGDALDIKTPLLRSINKLSKLALEFLKITGKHDATKITITSGPEQEYFLLDKAFYFQRPDLLMCGRTLFGSLMAKNQQLEDHYFGTIQPRILAFMQELDYELYCLGIPSKTRHNEVAPGQFEVAAIFREANLSSDQNQLVMATLTRVASKHDLVVLLHEKPFAGINGSGKHVNWSLADNTGFNFLNPGDNPETNHRFLAMVAIILEALFRHGDALRMSVASHGNDHRLGANEAPPSIISVYLGKRLTDIFEGIVSGSSFEKMNSMMLNMGSLPLAMLLQDNSDRNRTSPFAFTGNRFEFRAVGSSQAVGFPLSILNAAVSEVLEESIAMISDSLSKNRSVDQALLEVIKKWFTHARPIIFNGDGYSKEWVQEAESRGLPNLKTSADAIRILKDPKSCAFLIKQGVFKEAELATRYNVLLERYVKHREIEMTTLISMISHYVVPAVLDYKTRLLKVISKERALGLKGESEFKRLQQLIETMDQLGLLESSLKEGIDKLHHLGEEDRSMEIAYKLVPIMNSLSKICNQLEEIIPDEDWKLPKYIDMLFLK